MFLGLLGAGLMWMPASAILAAQMNNAAMSVQQNQGIKGTVVDATGETLIGASVKVAGTTNGAVTDIDGNFTLNCKPGATLEVSYIGYKTMTVKAANGMKITMQEDGKALNEVVVTALGIKRDRKALGYGLRRLKVRNSPRRRKPTSSTLFQVRWLVSLCRTPLAVLLVLPACFFVVIQKWQAITSLFTWWMVCLWIIPTLAVLVKLVVMTSVMVSLPSILTTSRR